VNGRAPRNHDPQKRKKILPVLTVLLFTTAAGLLFTTAAGAPMTFARGPVWVVLAPRP
jgi:hypothetical protein